MKTLKSNYFYGHKVSQYGVQHNRVDYATLATSFDHILNNEIMETTLAAGIGDWVQIAGWIDNHDQIDELEGKIEELEEKIKEEELEEKIDELEEQIRELEEQIDELEREQDEQPEVYQWYIVDAWGAQVLEEANEIIYYNEDLDMHLWGVTHWGTSWDYVLTNIAIECEEE